MLEEKDKLIDKDIEESDTESDTATNTETETETETDTANVGEYRFLQEVAISDDEESELEDIDETEVDEVEETESTEVTESTPPTSVDVLSAVPKSKALNLLRQEKETYENIMGSDIMENIPHGLKFLVDGYIDYAKEVVVDRAIPNIDGMKPSQRRIMYIMRYIEKVKSLRKCGDIAGSTMKIHPHGDASIYDTMVRMTHSSYYLNIPFIHGKGSFGKVYSRNGKAAAARYTECEFERVADELFQGMGGVEMIPSFNNEFEEPVLLPVSFPVILCNPSQGIAIGIASNIPSFNFHEVLHATIELLETGKITKLLAPDFTTGGCYIEDKTELKRLMTTGNAKLKLRGKWHIEGKVIVIDEIPYYTTVEDIMNKVKDIPGVTDVKDECDKRGLRISIECATKKLVDEVLNEVLRVSPLQMTFTSNIVVIVDNKPRVIGVYEILEEWVKFREEVISKQIIAERDDLIFQIASYDILVDLMTTDKRDPFIQTLLNEGRSEARVLLGNYYPTTQKEIFDWILDKSLGSLGGIGQKQKDFLEELRVKLSNKEEELRNVKSRIVDELKALDKKYVYPRLTEITEDDYNFDSKRPKKMVEAVPVVFQINGKFIKKMKATPTILALPDIIKCQSTDTISFIDNKARLLRVHLDQLEFSNASDKGTYLPLYLGEQEDNFEIIATEIVSDKKIGYMYKDGYAAIIDYNEWLDVKRKTKMTPDGLAPAYIDSLIGSFDMSNENIVMLTKRGKLGVVKNDFMQKSRRARTKLIHVGKGDEVVSVASLTSSELSKCLENQERFLGHFRVITKADGFNKELFEAICKKK